MLSFSWELSILLTTCQSVIAIVHGIKRIFCWTSITVSGNNLVNHECPNLAKLYISQLSCLRRKSHAYRWKLQSLAYSCIWNNFSSQAVNLSYYSLEWHNYKKYRNSTKCKKRKFHPQFSNSQGKSTDDSIMFGKIHPRTRDMFETSRFRNVRNFFRNLRPSLDMVGSSWKSWHFQNKNLKYVFNSEKVGRYEH